MYLNAINDAFNSYGLAIKAAVDVLDDIHHADFIKPFAGKELFQDLSAIQVMTVAGVILFRER